MSDPRWTVEAQFQHHDQAKRAAEFLRGIQPIYLHVLYDDGNPETPRTWEEYARGYQHNDVRI